MKMFCSDARNKGRFRALVYWGTLFLIIMTLYACATKRADAVRPVKSGDNKSQNSELVPDAEKMQQIQQRIAKAVAQARKEGRTKVDIHLDETPDVVQKNDLVSVAFTAMLEGGTVITGTGQTAKETKRIVAGKHAYLPGLANEVIGMAQGELKNIVLPPEKAFGKTVNEKPVTLPAVRTFARVMEVDAQRYSRRFKELPSKGELVQVAPYFKSEVIKVTADKIFIENQARDGYTEQAPYGKTTIVVDQEKIIVSLAAKVGAVFPLGEKQGVIQFSDKKIFTVGFGHPFAGKKLHLNIEVLDLKKASEFKNIELPWIEDHDKGMDAARNQKKNKVLILYADWCKWCKKMFEETLTDPRVKELKDQFVWVKANSDKDTSLKAFYKQESFPMIVLTSEKGKILQKTEGFINAEQFLLELEEIMNPKFAKAENRLIKQ